MWGYASRRHVLPLVATSFGEYPRRTSYSSFSRTSLTAASDRGYNAGDSWCLTGGGLPPVLGSPWNVYEEKGEFVTAHEHSAVISQARIRHRLGGGAVPERSRRMWRGGPALFVSAKGGRVSTGKAAASTSCELLDLPAGGSSSSLPCHYPSLQNALRRLVLSMAWHSNPHLPPMSQPAAAQVPRAPPPPAATVSFPGQGPVRARSFRREGDTTM